MNRQDRIRRRQTAQAEATRPDPQPLPIAEAIPPAAPRGKGPSPEVRDEKMKKKGRLPGGAEFRAEYYAPGQMWSAKLTIARSARPDDPYPESLVFQGEGSGLFKLLSELDDQYRASLKGGGT